MICKNCYLCSLKFNQFVKINCIYHTIMMNLNRFIPQVSKRNLLIMAAAVWLFAGLMLLIRGRNMYFSNGGTYDTRIIVIVFFGIIFYFVAFLKVSNKHIQRILTLENELVPVYQFFNKRSYFMMLLMITLGFILRKTEIVSVHYLAGFYMTMGIPLVISALKFLCKICDKSTAKL